MRENRFGKQSQRYILRYCKRDVCNKYYFIHTAFWSGTNYVPDYIRNIVLALDVPLFFFVSGACQQYVKSFKKQVISLGRLYIKWMCFLPIYWILTMICGGEITTSCILRNLLFVGGSEQNTLPVVMGSMWFWPVYFIVVCMGSFFIHRITKVRIVLFATVVVYAIGVLAWEMWGNGYIKQGLKIVFYLMIFLMGYESRKIKVSMLKSVTICSLLFLISVPHLLGMNAIQMIDAKSPPVLTYCAYSLIGMVFMVALRRKITKKSLLSWVGENALLSLFAQGIAASFLYRIVDMVRWLWLPKFVACAVLNVCMTIVIIYLLTKYYNILHKISHGRIY